MGAPSILDSLSTGVAVLSADGRVSYLNNAAENLLGISVKRSVGERLEKLLPMVPELSQLAARALERQQGFSQELNLPAPHSADGDVEVALRMTPQVDGSLLVEFFDATRRQQINRDNALLAQHGVSRRMIRQLAHEIKNPLGGLRGAAQLLERELPREELREFTRIIIGEADRLAELMDNLLGPVRQSSRQELNIHELLEHVALLIESDADESFELRRDYDPSIPELEVDRNQIIQALLNLARNAMQATEGKGRVIFRTRALTNYMLGEHRYRLVASIEIEDDGTGIADEIRDTIFYPLVSGRDDGTGLGLALSQDLIARNGGLIEFQSEPGQTIFTVRLPIGDYPGAHPVSQQESLL